MRFLHFVRNVPSCAVAACAFLTPSARAQTPTASFQVLHRFANSDGEILAATLIQGKDGALYGATEYGGTVVQGQPSGAGTVFRLTTDGTFTTLHLFNGVGGANPVGPLLQGLDGAFYGTTLESEAVNPAGGATYEGTAFRLAADGTFSVLHQYDELTASEGSEPASALLQVGDGSFYGTTFNGGSYNSFGDRGAGTVFHLAADGTLTKLFIFANDPNTGTAPDGANPSGLVRGADGDFYGTTEGNGVNRENGGTVFKIDTGGFLTTVHDFGPVASGGKGTDGVRPVGGLILASDGNFYGTTESGGVNGQGTVFRVNPDGTFLTLHSFGGSDGASPEGGVIEGRDGNFYGTTYSGSPGATTGGANSGYGTVFQISPTGVLTTLHYFADDLTEGATPSSGLVQGSDGSFYGTTRGGGFADGSGGGTVFKVTINDLAAGSLQFTSATFGVNENAGRAVASVARVGGTLGPVSVTYATADGTAVDGFDYTATSGTLAWADGDATPKTFAVPVTDEGATDGGVRMFTVVLSAPQGAPLGTPATAAVAIHDNDPAPGAPVISSALTANATQGTAFTYAIMADGATGYDATGLPDGLAVNTANGVISGTPTVPGTFDVTVSATNDEGDTSAILVLTVAPVGSGSGSVALSLRVHDAPDPVAVGAQVVYTFTYINGGPSTATHLGLQVVKDSHMSLVSVSNGFTPAVNGNVINLALRDLVVNVSGTVALTFTANAVGTLTVGALLSEDQTESTPSTSSLLETTLVTAAGATPTPSPAAAPVITSAAAATGTQGTAFTYQIAASNAPTLYAATGLPSGLTLDPVTGLIAGTPTQAGTFSVALSATNATGTGLLALTVTVARDVPAVSVLATVKTATFGGQEGTITFSLDKSAVGTLKMLYKVKGSAANGVDYDLLSGVVKFKKGKTTKTITVVGHQLEKETKVLKLVVLPSDQYTIATPGPVKVKILP